MISSSKVPVLLSRIFEEMFRALSSELSSPPRAETHHISWCHGVKMEQSGGVTPFPDNKTESSALTHQLSLHVPPFCGRTRRPPAQSQLHQHYY